ncbi:AbrB/MazE/SpoVT family DNA-binding domain-containing protein [Fusobacterium mortiferum]|uniref:AbrB/MazE/SpoVT family DNA-binding domain-containing protein n=1 Tax=Fusobacterium mortiferum TaxID=850 RepID=A0ABS2G3Y1_FUSMR|nr:AbrB/MazE/SpoVT family DNA-binding domain-containing protein [Fusobacterium mortiferum]MBM6876144.1 AbrB/MazE/SpoVT family DNA-binding domain-containing protein [Fusobacterium mortiferum]
MEKRTLKISFGKSGNGGLNPKISIPKTFLDKLNITQENREVEMILDEDNQKLIIIKKD